MYSLYLTNALAALAGDQSCVGGWSSDVEDGLVLSELLSGEVDLGPVEGPEDPSAHVVPVSSQPAGVPDAVHGRVESSAFHLVDLGPTENHPVGAVIGLREQPVDRPHTPVGDVVLQRHRRVVVEAEVPFGTDDANCITVVHDSLP